MPKAESKTHNPFRLSRAGRSGAQWYFRLRLPRETPGTERALQAVDRNLTATAVSRPKLFNSADLARAKEACSIDFNQRSLSCFEWWSKALIAAALDKLREEFKQEFWDEERVFLQMLKTIIKQNKKEIKREADKTSAKQATNGLQRDSADAQLASLAVGLSLAANSDSRRKAFNSTDLARAKEVCGLQFNQRRPMCFERWPKKVIAGALDKLEEQFKEEFVEEREVFLQMLEKLVKDNNKRITGEADKLRNIAHAAKGNVQYHFTDADLDRARQVSEFPFDRFRIWSDISKKERDAVCTRFYKKFNHKGWGRSGYQALLKRLIEDHNMGLKKEVIDADVEMTIVE